MDPLNRIAKSLPEANPMIANFISYEGDEFRYPVDNWHEVSVYKSCTLSVIYRLQIILIPFLLCDYPITLL